MADQGFVVNIRDTAEPAPRRPPTPTPTGRGFVVSVADVRDPAPGEIDMMATLRARGPRKPIGEPVEVGNIDLFAQPKVKNPAGGTSTVYSFSVNMDGKEYLLARVTPDGRLLSEDDAVREFQRTGKHLGIFDSPESATTFAQKLHDDYASGKYERSAPPRSFLDVVKDFALIPAASGIIEATKIPIGLADVAGGAVAGLATGRHDLSGVVGRTAASLGYQPDRWKEALASYYSERQQQANLAVAAAGQKTGPESWRGWLDRQIAQAEAVLSHPSVIATTIVESLPSMYGGGRIARGLLGGAAAARAAGAGAVGTAAAIGEGAVSAGAMAESIRAQSPEGRLSPGQTAAVVGAGAAVGALGRFGNRLAARWGVTDVDTLIAAGVKNPIAGRNLARAVLVGAITEGGFEELPQSVIEQALQNQATGKPLDEGISTAAVLGFLAGAVMGGAVNVGAAVRARPLTIAGEPFVMPAEEAAALEDAPPRAPATPVPAGQPFIARAEDLVDVDGAAVDTPVERPAEATSSPPIAPGPSDASTTPSPVTAPSPSTAPITPTAADWIAASKAIPMVPLTDADRSAGRRAPYLSTVPPLASKDVTIGDAVVDGTTGDVGVVESVDTNRGHFAVQMPDGRRVMASNLSNQWRRVDDVRPYLQSAAPQATPTPATATSTPSSATAAQPTASVPVEPASGVPSPVAATPETSPSAAAVEPAEATEAWQMTRAEHRVSVNRPRVAAIQAAIRAGRPLVLATQTRATRLTSPEHIRITARGEVQIPRGRQWDTLVDEQVERLAAQAGLAPVAPEARVYHRAEVERALQEGRPVPSAVLADYPDLAGPAVDTAAESEETIARGHEEGPGAGEGGLSALRGVTESRPRRRESPGQTDARRRAHYGAVWRHVLANARQLDPAVDARALKREFTRRVEFVDDLQREYRESGYDPVDLLKSVARLGGIGITAESRQGYAGEVRLLKEAAGTFGSLAGVQGVFRADGHNLDDLVTMLRQDARFQWIEDIDTLMNALDAATRGAENPQQGAVFPGTQELADLAGIRPNERWWDESPWQTEREAEEPAPEPTPEPLTAETYQQAFGGTKQQAEAVLAVVDAMGIPRERLFVVKGGTPGASGLYQTQASLRAFLEGEPVTTLTGDEFAPGEGPLTERVTRWYQERHHGHVALPSVGDVQLDRRAVKNSIAHGLSRAKSAAFAAVPDVLAQGRILHDGPWNDKAEAGRALVIGAPISIAGTEHVALVLIHEDANARRMYVHEVVVREGIPRRRSRPERSSVEATPPGAGAGFLRSILENIFAVKDGPDILYQDAVEPAPIFYSKLRQVLAEKLPNRVSAGQVFAIAGKPQNGVKAEEFQWSGLRAWLETRPNPTKQEVLDFLDSNQIQVKEVVLGDPSSASNAAQQRVEQTREDLKTYLLTEKGFTERGIGDYLLNAARGDLSESQFQTAQADPVQWAKVQALREAYATRERVGGKATPTKFGGHTLPGGENYRELLLTLPATGSGVEVRSTSEGVYRLWNTRTSDWLRTSDGKLVPMFHSEAQARRVAQEQGGGTNFTAGHFDEPNVLAHVRFNDRTDADGKKVLFIEEVQSDWHQKGRREGYRDGKVEDTTGWTAMPPQLEGEARGLWRVRDVNGVSRGNVAAATEQEAIRTAASGRSGTAVPDAPFKTTWPELATKRMLRYAAEHGYEVVAWTTGDQQNARYDLSQHLDQIQWEQQGDVTQVELVLKDSIQTLPVYVDRDGRVSSVDGSQGQEWVGKPLSDVIGKEAADKIAGSASGVLKGEGLKIGGSGMKGFYDEILPRFLNRYGKQWGARVGTVALPRVNDPGTHETLASSSTVHGLAITPAMRASVMTGQPLFQGPHASVEFTEEGEAVLRALSKPNVSSGVHELAHVARRFLFDRSLPQELREGITDEDILTAEAWAGAENGEWSREAEEKFARGFERYLANGQAPTASLQSLFDKFARWLSKVYQRLTGSPIDIEISPAMRQVFDRLVTRTERLQQAEAEGDTSFDVEAFEQELGELRDVLYQDESRGLFDEPESDVLDTGEVQPRLPEAGAVRDQEVATPTLDEVPFSLTSEVSRAKKGSQNTLFQDAALPSRRPVTETELRLIARARNLPVDLLRRRLETAGYRITPGVDERPTYRPEPGREVPPQKAIPRAKLLEFPSIQKMPAAIRDNLADLLEQYQGFEGQRRGVQSWARTQELAKDVWLPLETLAPGTALNAEELEAYKTAIATALTERKALLVKIADGTATDEDKLRAVHLTHVATTFTMAYRGAKAEAGRALNILRSQARVLDLQESKFLEAALAGPGFAGDLQAIAKELTEVAGDPLKQLQLLRRRASGSWFDLAQAAYYNSLLSGVKTHLRNIIGNTANIAANTLTPLGAAPVEALRGGPRTVYASEIPVAMRGAWIGLAHGLRNAGFTLRHGFRPATVTAAAEGGFDRPRVELPGGLLTNLPSRALEAADEFFRAVAFHQELYAGAYAQARSEGLTSSRAISDRMAAILTDTNTQRPTGQVAQRLVRQAERYAARAVFQEETGPIVNTILRFKQAEQPIAVRAAATFLLPFVRTPGAIFRQGFEWTPAGFAMRAARATEGREQAQALSRAALGSVLLAPMAWLAANGLLTGAPPDDEGEREEFYALGKLGNAVRLTIGGQAYWVRYTLFQPFSVPLAAVANAWERFQASEQDDAAAQEAFVAGVAGAAESLAEQSFLLGFSRFMDAMTDPKRYAGQWLSLFAQGLVPASGLLRNITQAVDPAVRRPEGVVESVESIIPGASEELRPRRNRFGDVVVRPGHWLPRGFLVPEVSREQGDDVTQTLARLSIQPSTPRARWTVRGERVVLTRDQEDAAIEAVGRERRYRVERLLQRPGFAQQDDERQRRQIERAIGDATDQVRPAVLRHLRQGQAFTTVDLVSSALRAQMLADADRVRRELGRVPDATPAP